MPKTKKKTRRKTSVSPAHKDGRPPFRPTDDDRQHVETLAGFGLRREEICLLVRHPKTGAPITEKTLRRHFAHELAVGAPKMGAKVADSLVKRALDMSHPQGATCAIWYSKCRMGWKERVAVDVDVKSGVLIPPASMTPDEWIAAAALRAAKAKEPGSDSE